LKNDPYTSKKENQIGPYKFENPANSSIFFIFWNFKLNPNLLKFSFGITLIIYFQFDQICLKLMKISQQSLALINNFISLSKLDIEMKEI